MEYERGICRSLDFGAVISMGRRNSLELKLLNERGTETGITLVCTRRFLKRSDAEAYLRIKRLMNDSRVEAGIRIPF
jgi:hypothetical protein